MPDSLSQPDDVAKQDRPSLSVVIPALNESGKISGAIAQIREFARSRGMSAEVIVVNDGSTDDTAAIVESLVLAEAESSPNDFSVKLLTNPRRRGKGYSVRKGMRNATGDIAMFSDADMSTPMSELDKFLPHFKAGCDVVIGSRVLPESQLNPPQAFLRRFLGGAFRKFRRIFMLRDIHDTQCGFKAFTRPAAADIFERQRNGGPAFDCEILMLARQHGYRIKEVGIVWQNDPDSRIHLFRDGMNMLLSIVKIWWRCRKAERLQ